MKAYYSDNKLSGLTELINTGRLDYYDCWFFSLLVKRPYDRRVNIYASQDKNLKDWPWFTIGRNVVDVGAFGRFFAVEKAFVDFDILEEEFVGVPNHQEQPEYAKWLRSFGISWNN
ncbi:Protein R04F11.5 [Aphelenchoides avenae]|nr:Protein R04F11.5 [Aphelenchus avenae]